MNLQSINNPEHRVRECRQALASMAIKGIGTGSQCAPIELVCSAKQVEALIEIIYLSLKEGFCILKLPGGFRLNSNLADRINKETALFNRSSHERFSACISVNQVGLDKYCVEFGAPPKGLNVLKGLNNSRQVNLYDDPIDIGMNSLVVLANTLSNQAFSSIALNLLSSKLKNSFSEPTFSQVDPRGFLYNIGIDPSILQRFEPAQAIAIIKGATKAFMASIHPDTLSRDQTESERANYTRASEAIRYLEENLERYVTWENWQNSSHHTP